MQKVRTIRTRQQAYRARHQATGVCADCPTPCTGYRCPACNTKRRHKQKFRMRRRRAQGIAD